MRTLTAGALAARIRTGLDEYVVGGHRVGFALVAALFARGHILIEGVPGTGKTLAVRALAALLGLEHRRIQFTPDLLPSDVVGTTVFNPRTAEFSLRPGPILTSVLLADEINRTPPKTQSALLEAMEEGRVTIDGESMMLPAPFIVCATQNPIEYEGTYPLPEAQLDRFLIRVESEYPAETDECELLARVAGGFDARSVEPATVTPVASVAEVLDAQQETRRVHVGAELQRYIRRIAAQTRTHAQVTLGVSTRGAVALLVASQAAAAIDGREFATPDDVKSVAPLVLPHRIIVDPQAEMDGVRSSAIVADLLASIPVPRDLV